MAIYFKKNRNLKSTNWNSPFLTNNSKSLMNMNWKESKKLFPELSPYGDIDADGIINKKDCKPFDPLRHGFWQRAASVVSGGRYGQSSEEYKQERVQRKRKVIGQQYAERGRQLKLQTKKIGGEVSELVKEREQKEKLSRAYEKVESEQKKIREAKKTIYPHTFAGRINIAGGNVIKSFAKGRVEQLRTAKRIRAPIPLTERYKGRIKYGRGRPRGSFDPRYTQYGGVYGYRKVLSAQLQQQRFQAMQQATISPEQQAIINQMEAQKRAKQINPENQVLADTYGNVSLKNIHQEIDDAANIFP